MKKSSKVIIGVLLLLVVIVLLMIYSKNSDKSAITQELEKSPELAEKLTEDERFKGTFLQLLALGKNYMCSFDSTDAEGNTTNGKVYVAAKGDMLRGDFTYSPKVGDSFKSNVIRDGKYNYIWSSLDTKGFKVLIDKENDTLFGTTSKETSKEGNIKDDTDVDFNCKKWSIDNSLFVPPTTIEFIDFSEQMKGIQEQMKETTNCSVCDQIPSGDSKDQCLKALGC